MNRRERDPPWADELLHRLQAVAWLLVLDPGRVRGLGLPSQPQIVPDLGSPRPVQAACLAEGDRAECRVPQGALWPSLAAPHYHLACFRLADCSFPRRPRWYRETKAVPPSSRYTRIASWNGPTDGEVKIIVLGWAP